MVKSRASANHAKSAMVAEQTLLQFPTKYSIECAVIFRWGHFHQENRNVRHVRERKSLNKDDKFFSRKFYLFPIWTPKRLDYLEVTNNDNMNHFPVGVSRVLDCFREMQEMYQKLFDLNPTHSAVATALYQKHPILISWL